ncbi:MAG: NirD/YgiW/YdeI family stress tolerance protein [Desulfobulbaceae bacterium]|jgi:uncharacterized protein (TIGR00156 family)|nr:NirD/YgiW/YdeI family stress tolerance protein [Desulfobulbaceae bacterium]
MKTTRWQYAGFLALALTLGLVAPAGAEFVGPGSSTSTAREALNMRDDTPVSLVGNIVQRIGGDTYLFRDQTGSINVDIDAVKWDGQKIGPDDKVRIDGEVDRDWMSVEIDVDRITKDWKRE